MMVQSKCCLFELCPLRNKDLDFYMLAHGCIHAIYIAVVWLNIYIHICIIYIYIYIYTYIYVCIYIHSTDLTCKCASPKSSKMDIFQKDQFYDDPSNHIYIYIIYTHTHIYIYTHIYKIDGLLQGRRNFGALTMEIRLSCTNPFDNPFDITSRSQIMYFVAAYIHF